MPRKAISIDQNQNPTNKTLILQQQWSIEEIKCQLNSNSPQAKWTRDFVSKSYWYWSESKPCPNKTLSFIGDWSIPKKIIACRWLSNQKYQMATKFKPPASKINHWFSLPKPYILLSQQNPISHQSFDRLQLKRRNYVWPSERESNIGCKKHI